jgi:hypothetical protein
MILGQYNFHRNTVEDFYRDERNCKPCGRRGGPSAALDIKLGLGDPGKRFIRRNGVYSAKDTVRLTFVGAKRF